MADRVPSTSAKYRVGVQTAKGTPSEDFLCGLMQLSGLNSTPDNIDKGPEHGCAGGTVDRITAHKSLSRRSSYLVNSPFRSAFYPDLFGYMLLGAGFEVTTTAGALEALGTYSHVFTLAARNDLLWLTVLSQIGDKLRRGTDLRVNRLEVTGAPAGLAYNGTMQGLTEDEGTDVGITTASESPAELLYSRGEISVLYDPTGTPVEIVTELERLNLVIDNPLDVNQQRMFTYGRIDAVPTGLDISGRIEGLPVNYDHYERLVAGGLGNDVPAELAAVAALDWTWESAELIAATAIPYSCRVEIPEAEITLNDFQAEAANLVEWSYNFRMIDKSVTPVRITLVNTYPAYVAA